MCAAHDCRDVTSHLGLKCKISSCITYHIAGPSHSDDFRPPAIREYRISQKSGSPKTAMAVRTEADGQLQTSFRGLDGFFVSLELALLLQQVDSCPKLPQPWLCRCKSGNV